MGCFFYGGGGLGGGSGQECNLARKRPNLTKLGPNAAKFGQL